MLILNFSVFTCLLSLLVFCSKRKHLLLTLLSLEFIVLSLYFMLSFSLMFFNYEFFFLMIFLTFSVCEGALGLSILVSLVRTHGNDYFQSFNILW
ncbi:NADH dehydrogenase subunit 4L (mitochondrion) [Agrilus planipennis]|uniref:NADH-ubiquinone oxidoreductase chain 4L n=1 Tax=Agrilus planipennis TaxID=224129 RepID=A0A1B0VGX6_AGRPL|nr:NADH dehydrogenase subunit 4L [Agrilus planipennis]AMV73981.1 NADH dehydrogenase subunit 4L [Agrilus planipennis]